MSKENYPSVFSRQMEAIMFMSFATRPVLKIEDSPVLAGEYLVT